MGAMKRSLRALSLVLALSGLGLAHAQSFSTLEERMSAAEFKQAGLDKLSPAQLHYLDQWLRGHVVMGTAPANAVPPQVVGPANQFGYRAPADQPRTTVKSTLVGHFRGWDSHTRLPLENGQLWAVSESSSWSCQPTDNPKVTIKPMLLGSWLAYIEGCSNSVSVERVR